jgi:hypothetical protein
MESGELLGAQSRSGSLRRKRREVRESLFQHSYFILFLAYIATTKPATNGIVNITMSWLSLFGFGSRKPQRNSNHQPGDNKVRG